MVDQDDAYYKELDDIIEQCPILPPRHRMSPSVRAVIDAARYVVKVVRATGGVEGGHQWFKEIAALMDAVEELDGPFNKT